MEHELDERYLLVGEKLLEEGKVTKLFENERHLWIAEANGFEIEMQISPSKVKACSCECETFSKERMCGHVAGGLLLLRRQLTETAREPRQTKQSKSFSHQKLTVNAILDSVTQDELAAFVRNFARNNKPFSLALRAKFAAKVSLANNQEKFGQLLDAAILGYRKVNDRISAPGVSQLKKMVSELLGQADDALALEQFAEAWAILAAVVSRFSPILKKLDSEDDSLPSLIQNSFVKIEQLGSLPIPPDLQIEIMVFCEAEFNRPAYRINGFSGYMLRTWAALAKDDQTALQILQAIDNELIRSKLDASYHAQILLVKLELLRRPGLKNEEEAFTLECLSNHQMMIQVLDAVTPTGDFRPIKDLVEKGHRLIPDEHLQKRLESILLQIAQTEGKADAIVNISRQKFLETRDFEFYDKCQTNYEGNWQDFVKKLLADLVFLHDFHQNFSTIATILGREDKLEELLGLLEEQQSLDLLAKFDHFLIKKKANETQALYEKLLKAYLSNHLGPKASKRLKAVFEHLHKHGAAKMVEKLFESITTSYPKRRFYLEDEVSL